MAVPYLFAYYSFVIQFEIREHMYTVLFFFLKIPLAIQFSVCVVSYVF